MILRGHGRARQRRIGRPPVCEPKAGPSEREKISLWGISYGTHLALAAIKQMDDRLDRVVLSSAEGLDQTVKLPAGTDAYFDRMQATVDKDPRAKALYPDIKAMIARVHRRLEDKPVLLRLKGPGGVPADVLLQRRTLQMFEAGPIADPDGAVKMQAMPMAMDVASGISDARLVLVEAQAKTALLGDTLNFPMPHLRQAFPELDLGEEFRKAPVSHMSTLLLSGRLDGRTYPEAQLEAVAGLNRLQAITVVNAGHNLFMMSPEITAAIERFMRGEPLKSPQIVLPLPDSTIVAPPPVKLAPTAPKP